MKEFDLIERIMPRYYRQPSVIKGIGDDAAIVRPANGYNFIMASDTMVEEIHFSLEYMSLEEVGHRVLAANLSDLAAMGADPLYMMINLAVPEEIDNNELIDLYNGMEPLVRAHNIDLIGGDTVSAKQLVITLSIYGQADPSIKRLRNGALPGDIIFVTGYLGMAKYGFDQLQEDSSAQNEFTMRHKKPTPQTIFTEISQDIKRIALNDISDGISSELHEIADASSVDLQVEWDRLSINPKMKNLEPAYLKQCVLSGGEDFELVGTCTQEDFERLKEKAEASKYKITEVGRVMPKRSDTPTVYLKEDHGLLTLTKSGYVHGTRE